MFIDEDIFTNFQRSDFVKMHNLSAVFFVKMGIREKFFRIIERLWYS